MPAYGIANNLPKFQPFSFERLLQPLTIYKQAYDKVEEGLAALEDQAATLEKLKNSAVDQDSYNEYKAYLDKVVSARDSLINDGLSQQASRQLFDSRRGYASTIKPLLDASEKREKESLMQYQATLNNPYIRFSRNADETSLSQYKAGVPGIQVIDGTKLATMASQIAQQYAQSILNDEKKKAELVKKLPFKYQRELQYGMSASRFLEALQEASGGDPTSEAGKIVANIQNQVYNSSGLNSWSSKRQQELRPWAFNMINIGLNSLIGKTSFEILTDDYGMAIAKSDHELANNMALEQYKASLKGGDGGFALGNGADYIYNEVGLPEARQQFEAYKQFFALDSKGDIYLTQAGSAKYRAEKKTNAYSDKDKLLVASNPRDSSAVAAAQMSQNSDFVNFIDKIGAGKFIDMKGKKNSKGKHQYYSNRYAVGKAYKEYMGSMGISADGKNTRGTSIVQRTFDDNTSDNILTNLRSIMSSDIMPKHYNGKGQYVNNKGDKSITKADIINKNVRVQDVYFNEATDDVVIRVYRVGEKSDGSGNKVATENGKTYNIVVPKSALLAGRFSGVGTQLRKASSLYEKSKSEVERNRLDQEIRGYRQAIYQELGALGVLGKSKTEDYDPN